MRLLLYILLGCSIIACSSPSKLLEKGRYDDALTKALKKLNKSSDPELIDVALTAYDRLQAFDMAEYERLSTENDARKWEKMYAVASRIDDRQQQVQRYLPIYDRYGVAAIFEMAPTSEMLGSAAIGSAEYYYARGHQQLKLFHKSNDKNYARRAYNDFSRIKDFMSIYKDSDEWIAKSEHWATYQVYVEVRNYAGSISSPYIQKRLIDELDIERRDLRWVDIHTYETPDVIDFTVQITIENADISPDVLREYYNEYVDIVEEGETWLTNEDGSFVIDSSGNRVVVPVEVKVRAEVTKVEQIKEARLAGEIRMKDNRTNRWIDRTDITAESFWDNISCRWTGDRRALPDDLPRVGRPVAFPDEQYLIDDLLDKLTPTIRDYIESRSWDGIS